MGGFGRLFAAMVALAAVLGGSTAEAGQTVDAIRARGSLTCGVATGVAGFAIADTQGKWTGLTVDFCRAVAAALLGDAGKVKFTPLTPQQRFTAVQSGEVDLLATLATWTMTRDGSLGLLYAGVYFYDGQGFLVRKSLTLAHATELGGATVCTATGTTSELNLADYFRANKMAYKPVVFGSDIEARKAFANGRCDAFSADISYLTSIRATDTANPDDFVILPEVFTKEPLGPLVGRSDLDWFTQVKWVLYALIEAEERGVTSANADEMLKSPDPAIQRLLGVNGGFGQKVGLPDDWAYKAVKAVGNYGEIFERNVGSKTALGLKRGPNALWTAGGLMYAMPIR